MTFRDKWGAFFNAIWRGVGRLHRGPDGEKTCPTCRFYGQVDPTAFVNTAFVNTSRFPRTNRHAGVVRGIVLQELKPQIIVSNFVTTLTFRS